MLRSLGSFWAFLGLDFDDVGGGLSGSVELEDVPDMKSDRAV